MRLNRTLDARGPLAVLLAVVGLGGDAVLGQENVLPARILAMFDIDGRGGADVSPDIDGDGLPDSWEVGGLDDPDTDVPFPVPEAIVPGTPPQSIFNRRPVRTSATARDTDGDGLSDFIEVFGLKFIDDDGDGILDDATARDAGGNIVFNADGSLRRATNDAGEPIGEWYDFNGDGMPSIGEFPATNDLGAQGGFDYDGFVFTDPTNPDTDGDGLNDRVDNDPLVNPRSFGVEIEEGEDAFFPSGEGALANDRDFDNDGLGNGMDLGNDTTRLVDNPQDLQQVLRLFRQDLLGQDVIRAPEGLIEDLLGADWNGDGLFRLTDILEPRYGVTAEFTNVVAGTFTAGAIQLFQVQNPDFPDDARQQQALGFAQTPFPTNFNRQTYFVANLRDEGGVNAPLPLQSLLRPAGRDDNVFLPDPRIWTVLYAWRVPGFDTDGNGFIGFDSASFSGTLFLNDAEFSDLNAAAAPTSEHIVPGSGAIARNGDLDGVIQPCALPGAFPFVTALMLVGWRLGRRTPAGR